MTARPADRAAYPASHERAQEFENCGPTVLGPNTVKTAGPQSTRRTHPLANRTVQRAKLVVLMNPVCGVEYARSCRWVGMW
jgi:hypothetical protein